MILFKSSLARAPPKDGSRTLKIKQRKKQGTLRFASEMMQKSNSGKRKFLGKIRADRSSEIDCSRRKSDMIQILESLILAQDERWRRA